MIKIASTIVLLLVTRDTNAAVNEALTALCDILSLAQGRFARAMTMIMVISFSWKSMSGKVSWQEILSITLGITMLYAPKTIALFLLPAKIKGVSGSFFSEYEEYTPDEIIRWACPLLK